MRPPSIILDRADLADLDRALAREWLLSDGVGGYAASTVVGANTRGHHGLLVVPVPGVGPAVILAKLEEAVHLGDRQYPLSTNVYSDTVHPTGYANQTAFERGPASVTFTYRVGGRTIRKTVFCRHDAPVRGVIYEADGPAVLTVRLMLACRSLGDRCREEEALESALRGRAGVLALRPRRPSMPTLYVAHNGTDLDERAFWYRRVTYSGDVGGRAPAWEDLWSPCGLSFEIDADRPGLLTAGTEPIDALPDVVAWRSAAAERANALVSPVADEEEHLARLALAGDAFVVRRKRGSTAAVTRDLGDSVGIISGYPADAEWSRESLIALPGLTLVTGRFDLAESMLRRCISLLHDGLVPGRLPSDGADPTYNAMDAGLWFVNAVGEYWRYTQDADLVRDVLLPACRQVVKGYLDGRGSRWKAGGDGLVRSTASEVPLTWMDACHDGRPVTPRTGKPVEVQALWYNALRTLDALEISLHGKRHTQYRGMADIARASFQSQFWNYRTSSVYDVVEVGGHDTRLRPNQILAASLPFIMLNPQQTRSVVDAVQRHLLTPLGLRTLAPTDPAYVGSLDGVAAETARHQGAAWPWLMGPFVTAYMRAYGKTPDALRLARGMVSGLLDRLVTGECPGQVGEVYDGDSPHALRGRPASAAVGELLRAVWEDVLGRRGTSMTSSAAPARAPRPSRRGRLWGGRKSSRSSGRAPASPSE